MFENTQAVGTAIFSLRDVSVSYEPAGVKIPILGGINLDIEPNQIIGITGESGSGKSMTSLAIMGLTSFYPNLHWRGEIKYQGQHLKAHDDAQWRQLRGKVVSLILQQPMAAFNPVKKIGVQIFDAIKTHSPNYTKNQLTIQAVTLLQEVGLDDADRILAAFPHTLSGGQLQRIMIAMAICHKPAIIIADEATSSLDGKTATDIMSLLIDLHHKYKNTLMLISHDLEVLLANCDQIILLQNGQIVDHFDKEKLKLKEISQQAKKYFFHQPKNAKRQAFNAENNIILQVKQLNKSYTQNTSWRRNGKTQNVLSDINFELRNGEMLGISGVSGSGKSTLAKIIAGLVDADSGVIRFYDQSLNQNQFANQHSLRRRVQIIMQDALTAMNPSLTIGNQWLEVVMTHDKNTNITDAKLKIFSLMNDFRLDESTFNKFPSQLSGGQVQRASLMRHILAKPDLIIFDESLSALDRSTQEDIVNLIISLQEKWLFSGIFISHDIDLILQICHRHLTLQDGRVLPTFH